MMEYKRPRALSRRRASHPAKRASAASIAVFLLVCGIVVFVFCTSQAADWLVEHIFTPLFTSSEQAEDRQIVAALQSQDQPTPMPSVSPQPTYSSTTETLEKESFYLLQMGSFDTEEPAQEKAAAIRALGAAGYVYPDGALFRVFAACYENATDLTKVQDQIRLDGFENTAYILRKDAVHITIGGEEDDVDRIKAGIEWLKALPKHLMKYALVFDRDGLSVDQGILQAREWLQITQSLLKEMDPLREQDAVMPVISAMQDYGTFLSTFLQLDGKIDTVTFSALLKSLQIQTIVRYCAITG